MTDRARFAAPWILALLFVWTHALADSRSAAALDYLTRLQAESGAPGVSAAVAVNGEIVFSAGVGVADVESGLPAKGSGVHNIGSISKPIALIAVMQLVEQGKVKLDAEIQTYAPWFPRKERPITVRHLLTHTSGIRHYKDNELSAENINLFRHYAQFEESTRFWRDDPLVFTPGTKWLYSSYGSNLMQAIVESASGQPFETYLLENVWRPAGMLNTQLDVTPRIVPHRGKGYRRNPKTGALENAVNEDVSYKYAGGGMLSTDEDLCRFGHALNIGVLLKPQTLAEVYRPQLPPELQAPKQGLIFQVGRDAAGRAYAGHSGTVKGMVSQLVNYYKDGVVVALHVNFNAGGINQEAAANALAQFFLSRPSTLPYMPPTSSTKRSQP